MNLYADYPVKLLTAIRLSGELQKLERFQDKKIAVKILGNDIVGVHIRGVKRR